VARLAARTPVRASQSTLSLHFILEPAQPLERLSRTSAPARRVSRVATLWLPVAILLGFALLFALLFRDRLLPARDVRVVPAIAIADERTESPAPSSASDKPLFQASGWLEPDPFPVRATALTDGIVETVLVLEGESVDAGQTLATLVNEDARLRRNMLADELAMKQAEFDAHCVEVQTMLQQLAAEQAVLTQAEAAVEEAADRLARLTRGPAEATTESERVAARLEKTRREAAVAIANARIREISWDFNRVAYEKLAHVHRIEAAKSLLAEAQLMFDRARITAPMAGRVLRLTAMPGDKKMAGMDDMDSSTIAVLYNPAKLQVRVDVPLADAAGLAVGQRARVRCSLLADTVFEGEVTRIAGQADIQRNTLQAKVRLLAPDDRLRPEMICRVEFLASANPNGTSSTTGDLAVFVPTTAIVDGSRAWICDPTTRRVESRDVTPAADIRDGLQRVDSGIRPGEWVIDSPDTATLKPGQRVHPILKP
jgi:multidrug efflux pump subunit AcrA (membrane-fusion protein)